MYERDALLDPVKNSRFARLKNGAAQRKFLFLTIVPPRKRANYTACILHLTRQTFSSLLWFGGKWHAKTQRRFVAAVLTPAIFG
jgi:hypothetical protein